MKRTSIGYYLLKANIQSFYQKTFDILNSDNVKDKAQLFEMIKRNGIIREKFLKSYQCDRVTDLGKKQLYYNPLISSLDMMSICAQIISAFSTVINRFAFLKKEYTKYLVLGNLKESEAVIDQVENEIGYSKWGISQKLLLAELESGNKKCMERWNYYVKTISQDNNTLFFLLAHYKDLVDFETSYSRYVIELEKHLHSANREAKDYFESNLKIDSLCKRENISLLLQIELQFSLIDLFLAYENALLSYGENIFRDERTQWVEKILPQANIQSSVIINTQNIIGREIEIKNETSLTMFHILDLYTLGEYNNTLEVCRSYLQIVPQDLQIASILCKSLIHLNKGYNETGLPTYISAIYSIYALDDKYDDAVVLLQQEARKYFGISLGVKLRSFFERKNIATNSTGQFCWASFLLDETTNPNSIKQVHPRRFNALVSYFKRYCNQAINNLEGVVEGNLELCQVSKDRLHSLLSSVQCCCISRRFDLAIEYINELEGLCSKKNLYIQERFKQIKLLYYRETNSYLDAIRLLVDTSFEQERIFNRILRKRLFLLDYRTKSKDITSNINHIILAYRISPTQHKEQIIIYNNLLESHGYSSIFDSFECLQGLDAKKWRFFLHKVCTVELLEMDSRLFISGISPETARLKILTALEESRHNKQYIEEMLEIRKKESISDKIQTIKYGKINVDSDKIIKSKYNEWKEIFDRLIKYTNNKGTFYYTDFSSKEIIPLFNGNKTLQKYVVQESTQQEQIRRTMIDLIATITNELLFNEKYGLETYLSTRIRHGYCKGQLVSYLQNHHLISLYDINKSTYSIDECWRELCEGNETEYNQIFSLIVSFTKAINQKVNEVTGEWLRIRSPENGNGLFDYTLMTDANCIDKYISQIGDAKDLYFLYMDIIKSFWVITENNLKRIRRKIDDELTSYYMEKLVVVDSSIPEEYKHYGSNSEAFSRLYSNCQKAKADTSLVMQQFKEAFVHSNYEFQDFTLEELSQCIQKTLRQQYDTDKIKWSSKSDNEYILDGQFFLPFVDILCILANNAIVHSQIADYKNLHVSLNLDVIDTKDVNQEVISASPEFLKHKKYLSFNVTNNLPYTVDEQKIERKLKKCFDIISQNGDSRDYIQREGGSGLIKLCNIIEFQIDRLYFTEYSVQNHEVRISCIICGDKIIKE